MKKTFFLFASSLALFASLTACGGGSQVADEEIGNDSTIHIDRIDPTDWFTCMKNTSLQLLVYGEGIGEADVKLGKNTGVKIDSVVRVQSPNYLLVYLNLKGAVAGKQNLNFRIGDRLRTVEYNLKDREKPGIDHVGFSNADVLYMLMPDRFAMAEMSTPPQTKTEYVNDRTMPSLRHGGNLEGVRRHLDYFVDLGVTALWFTPVLENDSRDNRGQSTYHGYATTDYYRVDPRFGTNADYRRLCDEAHAKGLKVVMDMIFNHCGFDHPWVADMPAEDWFNTPEWLTVSEPDDTLFHAAETTGQSVMATPPVNRRYLQTSYKLTPVLDPYASQIDLRESVDGWFVPSMPDLNQRNTHVMTYLIQNSIWWIETVGIDGIRMDTYPYADAQGMARWMEELEREYPNFNTVGETWVTEPAYTAAWQKESKVASR
ncbi:MAG: cyclomaltodextrinase N-terminal domain-containing protein, partial [Bacteroidaceae bacterium]|nr:cyclomaltodextrinase N-terminal domain-containing protein [Bacteroidaceae bacterium]